MGRRSLKLLIGGEAGDGVFATADVVAKAFARAGLHVFTSQIYSSRIRGGHIYTTVRVSDEPLTSQGDEPDIVLGLDRNTVQVHGESVRDGGVCVYDSSAGEAGADLVGGRDVALLPVPAKETATREFRLPVMKNIVLAGAAFRVLGFDDDGRIIADMIREQWGEKGDEVVRKNIAAAARGRELAEQSLNGAAPVSLMDGREKGLLLISGNDAIALGAITAGCRFIASYPITPATDVLEFMVPRLPKLGGAYIQAEDELSAVHMAIGSAWAGVRSMTSTSGPGLSLMVEGLGLASMTETPIVVVDVQRAGPSTGIPTKTEQSDLDLLVYGQHGEAPRIVLAPSDTAECFDLAREAFNLADRYQCPVFIAVDQFLGQAKRTLPSLDVNGFPIDRGLLRSPDAGEGYLRFEDTESGLSPRAFPGDEGVTLKVSGLVHDEVGFPRDEPKNRVKMFDKLFRKMEPLQEEFPGPQVHGDPDAGVILVGWGSTKGVILEAMERLREEDGIAVRHLHFTHVWPLPRRKVEESMSGASRIISIENNKTGQFAGLLRRETGIDAERLVHYTGRPLTPAGLHARLREVLGS